MKTSRMRSATLVILVAMLAGCAQLQAPPYSTDFEALDRLKAAKPAAVMVAPVQPTDPDHRVNQIALRGAGMRSPSGTFARYLEDALVQDLKEISAFAPDAKTRLDATILTNDISVGNIATGTGTMEVALTITRDGRQRLAKTYKADISFESSFAAIVAVPAGQAAYPQLVRAMLREIYSDPQFVTAIRP